MSGDRARGATGLIVRGAAWLLSGLVLLVAGGPAPAVAVETDTFRLEPSPLVVQGFERRTFAYALEPEEAATDAVRVQNMTDETRSFRLLGADAVTDPASGAVTLGEVGRAARGVGGWISFEQEELTVEAGASQVVPFTVTRPAGSSAEGFGAVVAEELPPEGSEAGIDVVYQLAILVRLDGDLGGLRVGVPRMQPPVELFPSRSTVAVELENETLEPLTATVMLTAGGLTGRIWDLGQQEVRLEAGTRQTVVAEWTTVPRWGGFFKPAVSVAWEAGSLVREGPRALHPPLWLLALTILVVGLRASRELLDRRRHPQPAPVGPADPADGPHPGRDH